MDDQGQITAPLSQPPIYNDFAPSSSTSPSPTSLLEVSEQAAVQTQEGQQQQQNDMPWCLHWQPSLVSERFNINICSDDVRNDAWSCLIVLLTFWFFASSVLILGLYGSFDLQLGPNCSFLIQANPFFVHSIQARQINGQTDGIMLYGFHETPTLDVETTWSQNHIVSIEPTIHHEWGYYLNAGSKVSVSYDVKFPSSTTLFLVIAQGRESLHDWIYAPSYNTTISWSKIYGSGQITQDIKESGTYFVAVGNLNLETVEVYLNITVKALLYNTTKANFKCLLKTRVCDFDLHFLKPNAAVLTSSGPSQTDTNIEWYIQVSYEPQWITYFGGSCIVAAFIFALFRYLSNDNQAENQADESVTVREPLLSPKNNDHASWGSSYDSIPSDSDQDIDGKMILEESCEEKVSKEGEINSQTTRRLCVICFDATRDCFFLPCGHCATCFSCGSRIAEEAGTCPICRRKMKKVRKIFAV